jgi:hypothetical protein
MDPIKYTPNVSIDTSTMDPMGNTFTSLVEQLEMFGESRHLQRVPIRNLCEMPPKNKPQKAQIFTLWRFPKMGVPQNHSSHYTSLYYLSIDSILKYSNDFDDI